MRIAVVSDRFLSRSALAHAARGVPGAVVVAEVDNMADGLAFCQVGETDVLIADARLMEEERDIVVTLDAVIESTVIRLVDSDSVAGLHAVRQSPPWCVDEDSVQKMTAREREVFALLGVGQSTQDIADLLGVTTRTVKAHVGSILRKLGLETRLQAGLASLVYLMRMGLGQGLGQIDKGYESRLES